jgi:hypothetical protein
MRLGVKLYYYVDHGLAACRTGDIGEMELDGTLRIIDRQELSVVYCTIFLCLNSQKSEVKNDSCKQCCGYGFVKTSVADSGCLSRIPDTDYYPSRIPDPKTSTKERGEKKLVVITF